MEKPNKTKIYNRNRSLKVSNGEMAALNAATMLKSFETNSPMTYAPNRLPCKIKRMKLPSITSYLAIPVFHRRNA